MDDEEDNQEGQEIEDDDVPLAVMDNVADDQHCPLHLAGLILAAVTGGAYIGATRKQKKQIAKLEKELGDKER
ncbi:MAG: hypothetical protein HFI42_12280 [Lachnospiraceae bacterium]|nr:hypothetical protein [Lachnospiraceae bacterium]MCI9151247.1 hypothetical protein [Lachnospiraceae bacterium]